MACGCKGKGAVQYQLTFKGGEPTVKVDTLAEARTELRNSSAGGSMKVVPKQK